MRHTMRMIFACSLALTLGCETSHGEVRDAGSIEDDAAAMDASIHHDASSGDAGIPDDANATDPDGGAAVVQTVLVAYTTRAEIDALTLETSLESHAASLVAEANTAYANSGIATRLALAGVTTTDAKVEELGGLVATLQGVGFTDDGFYDELHEVRDALSADIVVVMMGGFCGGGAMGVPANAESAFAIVGVCTSGEKVLSFPHEIGHLQGCSHEEIPPPPDPPIEGFTWDPRPYARANDLGSAVTVMYSGTRGGERVPYFSSPRAFYEGMPTGTADRDCARRIDETAASLAAFR
jgi:peptidyl-Asp metalloendopeptidase